MSKKNKIEKQRAPIKKTIRNFMVDEAGFVTRDSILKVGLATVAGVGILGSFSQAVAGHTNFNGHANTTSHTNVGSTHANVPQVAQWVTSGACKYLDTTNVNVQTHTNAIPHVNGACHASHSSY